MSPQSHAAQMKTEEITNTSTASEIASLAGVTETAHPSLPMRESNNGKDNIQPLMANKEPENHICPPHHDHNITNTDVLTPNTGSVKNSTNHSSRFTHKRVY